MMNIVSEMIIPGRKYCCIKKRKKLRVPKLSLSKRMICDFEGLQLSEEDPDEQALQNQENYAKVALIHYILFGSKVFSLAEIGCVWAK